MPSCRIKPNDLNDLLKNFILPKKFISLEFSPTELVIQNIARQEKFIVEGRIPIYDSTFKKTFFNLEASNFKNLGKGTRGDDILIEVANWFAHRPC